MYVMMSVALAMLAIGSATSGGSSRWFQEGPYLTQRLESDILSSNSPPRCIREILGARGRHCERIANRPTVAYTKEEAHVDSGADRAPGDRRSKLLVVLVCSLNLGYLVLT
jgi:hypothetical protein